MNKPILNKAMLLVTALVITIGSFAQSSSQFWSAFEKCSEATEFQAHYPQVLPGQTQSLPVMDNGIEIPDITGVLFTGARTFTLEDKGALMSNGATEFFIIQDARFMPNGAHFEVIYYYNFAGNYEHFVRGNFTLTNLNGNWSVTAADFQ